MVEPLSFELVTDRFLLSGPIREDANAGNQFYGEDLAEWLRSELRLDPDAVIDEDWGWLVMIPANGEGISHDLAIYGYPEEKGELGGDWMIVVHASRSAKTLGFIPTRKVVEPDPRFVQALKELFSRANIEVRTAE